jgi:hypothetical protein
LALRAHLMSLNPMTTSKRTHKILSWQGRVLYKCPLPDGVPVEMAPRYALEQAVAAGVSLEGAELADVDLSYANLGSANLARANLYGANLNDAYLAHANLVGANLLGAHLCVADLTHAKLAHAVLSSANLTGAKLTYANLTSADLERADLEITDLSHARLPYADLMGASLKDAYLVGTELTETWLHRANPAGANLRGLKLVGSHPLLRIGPIGADGQTLLAWLTDAGLRIQTTLFSIEREEINAASGGLPTKTNDDLNLDFFGTREQFRAAIAQAHGGDAHAQEYLAALALIDKHAELWLPKAQPDAKAGTPDASETDDPSHI